MVIFHSYVELPKGSSDFCFGKVNESVLLSFCPWVFSHLFKEGQVASAKFFQLMDLSLRSLEAVCGEEWRAAIAMEL